LGSFFHRLGEIRILRPLKARDFTLLFSGQAVSLFGDQFYLVALPLLTLDLTGSGFVLGLVLMVNGASRALFDLVGGALSDRVSQRSILLISNVVRAAVAISITAVTFLNVTKIWHLYLFSLVFGVVDAFFYPAYLAVIPKLVEKDLLNAGNALMRGTARLMSGVGPAAAGLLITGLTIAASESITQDQAAGGRRFASSFAIDAATFIFAALTVWLMRERRHSVSEVSGVAGETTRGLRGLLNSIAEGLAYSLRDPLIRALLIFTAVIEFSFIGSSTVGFAVLAKTRFTVTGDAAQTAGPFAAMLSAFGFGMLGGMVAAGSIRMPRRPGRLIVPTMAVVGLSMVGLGFVQHVWVACVFVCLMGLGGGLSNIVLLGWVQSRSEPGMLGRVLSVVMFGTSVVEPLSYALAGIIANRSLTALFVLSGATMLLAAATSIVNRVIITSD
jgi:MFS family permease